MSNQVKEREEKRTPAAIQKEERKQARQRRRQLKEEAEQNSERKQRCQNKPFPAKKRKSNAIKKYQVLDDQQTYEERKLYFSSLQQLLVSCRDYDVMEQICLTYEMPTEPLSGGVIESSEVHPTSEVGQDSVQWACDQLTLVPMAIVHLERQATSAVEMRVCKCKCASE